MKVSEIIVRGRYRQNLGNLDGLAESIQTIGLLHPVVVSPSGLLIAGQRRLQACIQLGWTEVPVTVAANLDDARSLMIAERDENTCREDMTPSEKVAVGLALEGVEREAAKKRMLAGKPSGKFPEGKDKGETCDKVGESIGMSGHTYQRAKAVVLLAERDDLPEEDRELAKAAARQMDETGKVEPNYNRVRHLLGNSAAPTPPKPPEGNGKPAGASQAERVEMIRTLASEGHRSSQIAGIIGIREETVRLLAKQNGISLADSIIGKVRRLDSNRIIEETVIAAQSLVAGLDLVDVEAIDQTRIDGWIASLSESARCLNQLLKQLREAKS